MNELKSEQMKKVDIVFKTIEELSTDISARDHFIFYCHLKKAVDENYDSMLDTMEYMESGQLAKDEKSNPYKK